MKKQDILSCILAVLVSVQAHATALDDYLAVPDSQFSYTQVGNFSYDPFTSTRAYTLKLTSQAWRTSDEVQPTIWTHWVTVVVPQSRRISRVRS